MKTVKIKFTAFERISHERFLFMAKGVLKQIEDNNAVFGLPASELNAFSNAVADLHAKTIAASGDTASKISRNARNLQATVVLNILKQVSVTVLNVAYAQSTYQEQKAIVTLAGYPIGNDTREKHALAQVNKLQLKTSGQPGESIVYVSWKRTKAAAYMIQTISGATAGNDGEWTTAAVCTTSKCKLTLSPGTWSVRIISFRGTEMSEPSTPVAIVVG